MWGNLLTSFSGTLKSVAHNGILHCVCALFHCCHSFLRSFFKRWFTSLSSKPSTLLSCLFLSRYPPPSFFFLKGKLVVSALRWQASLLNLQSSVKVYVREWVTKGAVGYTCCNESSFVVGESSFCFEHLNCMCVCSACCLSNGHVPAENGVVKAILKYLFDWKQKCCIQFVCMQMCVNIWIKGKEERSYCYGKNQWNHSSWLYFI